MTIGRQHISQPELPTGLRQDQEVEFHASQVYDRVGTVIGYIPTTKLRVYPIVHTMLADGTHRFYKVVVNKRFGFHGEGLKDREMSRVKWFTESRGFKAFKRDQVRILKELGENFDYVVKGRDNPKSSYNDDDVQEADDRIREQKQFIDSLPPLP